MAYFEKVKFPIVEEITYSITDDQKQTVTLTAEQAYELLEWLEQFRDELLHVGAFHELFPPEELPASQQAVSREVHEKKLPHL
jgi:DNA-binding PadR family transcriptional regulator